MNVRELWDTVVLRDVLGYTLPGAVTVFAVALLWQHGGTPRPEWCEYARRVWEDFQLLALGGLLAVGFVIGHVQMQIITGLEQCVPGWNLGKLAVHFLSDAEKKMRHTYCKAALDLFDTEWALRKGLSECRLPREPLSKDSDSEACARTLWRLCDYYVLVRDPNSHGTYMGRYYVLAVLFSNLGLSAIILATSAAVIVSRSNLHVVASLAVAFIVACAYFLVVFFVLSPYGRRRGGCRIPRDRVLRVTDTILIGVSLAAMLLGSWMGEQVLPGVLLLLGLVLIYWSGQFRREFIERAFPLFYGLKLAQMQRGE